MEIVEFLKRLDNVKKSGSGYSARCQGHEDTNNSLSVGEGSEGRILLKCFVGCPTESILKGMGLEMMDVFAEKNHEKRSQRGRGGGISPPMGAQPCNRNLAVGCPNMR